MAVRKARRRTADPIEQIARHEARSARLGRAAKAAQVPVMLFAGRAALTPELRSEIEARERLASKHRLLYRLLERPDITLKDVHNVWPGRGAPRKPQGSLQAVYEYLQTNPTHRKRTIAKALGIDPKTVKARLETLKRLELYGQSKTTKAAPNTCRPPRR
jgi:hypothetical protein